MVPEKNTLHPAITHQGIMLGEHKQLLHSLIDRKQSLAQQIAQLTIQVSTSHLLPSSGTSPVTAAVLPPVS